MYIAIGIGTLLLGGWVLNSPPADDQAGATTPSLESTVPLLPSPLPSPPPETANPRSPTVVPMLPGAQPSGQQPAVQAPARSGVMPMAPTEAAPPGTPGTPGLSPPTQPALGEGPAGGAPPGAAGGAYAPSAGGYLPMAPTYRAPTATSMTAGNSPYNAFTQQQSSLAGAWTPQKAFTNYQAPSSGPSPYMNLFRTGTNNGTIDNYTTLVRPALQQETANQQFGSDIFGLQRNARLQGAALLQLDRQPRTLQGVGTPQYYLNSGMSQPYMNLGGNYYGGNNYGRNYGGYYPALGQ